MSKPIFRDNLLSNTHTTSVSISGFIVAKFACGAGTKYYLEGFTCKPTPCSNLFNGANMCQDCASTCKNCTTGLSLCNACYSTQFRVLNSTQCDCNYALGYFDNDKDICEVCSDYLPGCVKCTRKDSCDVCHSNFIRENTTSAMADWECICPIGNGIGPGLNGEVNNSIGYMVSGMCLYYPGCIEAQIIATGKNCINCSDTNNFKIDSTTNNTCECKIGYYNDNDP